MIAIPGQERAVIRQEGERVLVIVNGVLVMDLPWDKALDIGRAIQAQARKAEEMAKADVIIADEAILMRAGAPFRLTTREDLRHEAGKVAAWDSSLRRYMRRSRLNEGGTVYPLRVKIKDSTQRR